MHLLFSLEASPLVVGGIEKYLERRVRTKEVKSEACFFLAKCISHGT
jgi:hypothetical protein